MKLTGEISFLLSEVKKVSPKLFQSGVDYVEIGYGPKLWRYTDLSGRELINFIASIEDLGKEAQDRELIKYVGSNKKKLKAEDITPSEKNNVKDKK